MSLGTVEKHGPTWRVRYTDNTGNRRSKSGFTTKKRAQEWAQRRLDSSRGIVGSMDRMSLQELIDEFLGQHRAMPATIKRLTHYLTGLPFADEQIGELATITIARWRMTLTEAGAYEYTRALRQVLKYAVTMGYLAKSPVDPIKNPQPAAPEVTPLRDWSVVEAISLAMPDEYRHIPILAVGTGLRPQEWTGLRWEHIDFEGRCINLPATIAKTGKGRRIPMRQRVVDALTPVRALEGLVVGISSTEFRSHVWIPALKAVGMAYQRPYTMRHTYAAWCLRAGVSTFMLSRRMGTGLEQIERTYGGFVLDSEAHELAMLDAFDGASCGALVGHDEPTDTPYPHALG